MDTDARTTLNYIHLRGGITEQAMTDVSNSLKLDAVGRGFPPCKSNWTRQIDLEWQGSTFNGQFP
jgi:hypothetical protein